MENGIVLLFASSLIYMAPLLYATLGEILMEKNGSLNLGLEGVMAVGAITGYVFAAITQSLFVGVLTAFIFSGLLGLLYSILTVSFKANQNVTGLSITIFGVALQVIIGETLSVMGKFPKLILGTKLANEVARKPFGVLGKIPYIGNIFFKHSALIYLAVALAIALWVFIKFTKPGAKLRAVGENPGAADAVGINVGEIRYTYTIIGSGIAGIGGLTMALIIQEGSWNYSWINGYGWMALSLVIFSSWSALRAILTSWVFGILIALSAQSGILALSYPKTLGFLSKSPIEVYEMLPFILTVVAIIISSLNKKKQNKAPSSLGVNYFREDR